jgi:hypothetical protein
MTTKPCSILRPKTVIALVLGLILIGGLSGEVQASAKPLKTPHQIIGQLRLRITAIGKTTASAKDFDVATDAALDDLKLFIRASDDLEALTRKDDWGKTPLNHAAYMGFSKIVTELLAQPSVKISLNEPDDVGVTPWTYAVFAVNQSAFACNPKLFNSPFSWSSLYASHPYYTQRSPYEEVRKILEQAGAETDMAKAKTQWQAICVNQTADVKRAVAEAADIQMVVIEKGDKALQRFLDTLQRH